jgi:hypothetical protein
MPLQAFTSCHSVMGSSKPGAGLDNRNHPNGIEWPAALSQNSIYFDGPVPQHKYYDNRFPYTYQQQPPTYGEVMGNPNYLSSPRPNPSYQPATMTYSRPSAPRPTSAPASSSSGLEKPIAIPSTAPKYGSAFLRAYPPVLERYNLSAVDFLAFLDNLNRVMMKSPPLQVLSLAGGIVGFVPIHTAQLVGGAVQMVSDVAAGAMQRGMTEVALKRANTEIFGPRGLKVEVAKTEAVAKLTGMPNVLDVDGKLNKKAKLLIPLEADADVGEIDTAQRRLDSMRPWIAELQVIPSSDGELPTSTMARLGTKMVGRKRAKQEKKTLEDRGKAHTDYSKETRKAQEDFDKDMRKLDEDLDKDLRDIERKLAEAAQKSNHKDIAKLQDKREKVMAKYDKQKSKIEREYQKEMDDVEADFRKDDKEEKTMRKLYWLIIREKSAPSGQTSHPDLT